MARILLVSDARVVLDELESALYDGEHEIATTTSGAAVRKLVEADPCDLVIADSQIGNMGGMAVCIDLKLEESGGRIPNVPVLLVLDRRADVHLARRAGADGWLLKPLDALRIRRAADTVLGGWTFHDDSFKPVTIPAPAFNS